MGIREVFAKNLRARRTELGLSQEELADKAGLDRTYISSLERGKYAASIDAVDMLAKALKVAPPTLLEKPGGTKRSE
ncbi:XRE family transcriptional regulator [Rhizomicrobium sp. SCGC AG-212-E05]|nr:XRE family transcriptional regulator [Rhizomicrobium sp. SCGC AG-212-E05]